MNATRSRCGLFRRGADHHDHLAAFHLGHVLDLADAGLFHVIGHPLQKLAAEIEMRHFAAAKAQADLHLVAVFEETEDIAHLHVVIVLVGVGAEFHFLDVDRLLLLARLGFALLLFVFELAVIHDLADRRIGIGRDLDKIEPGLVGQFKGFPGGNNAKVFAVGPDQPDFRRCDSLVGAWSGIALRRGIVRSAGYGFVPSVASRLRLAN